MTDILTHAVVLQSIESWLNIPSVKILDIGTGHGYLAFTIAKILANS